MTRCALLAPGYQGSADQAILKKLASRLGAVGIAARAMEFTTRGGRPSRGYGREIDDLRVARDRLLAAQGGPIALVGRSFGGRMCTFLAVSEPPAALVVLGHPVSPPGRPRLEDEEALSKLTCPTLIVQGDRDELGPLDVLQRIAVTNSRIEIAIIRGAAHSYGSKESEATEAAVTWLERVLR